MSEAIRLKKPKPSVSIIGCGRMGTALAIALSSSGYPIQAVVTRRIATGRKAASLVGRNTLALKATDLALLPSSTILLVTTPDDEIAKTVRSLSGRRRQVPKGGTVLHTSGALASDVLQPLNSMGFHVGSLHPLVSVSDSRTGHTRLSGAFYCIEGDAAATRIAQAIVRDLKGRSFTVSAGNKPLYHAAAVMTSGHFVALYDLAAEMLVQCGLERGHALRVLLPLLKSTVGNLARSDPACALTGTFARGDIATVRRHLQALSGRERTEALEVYKLLGARSLKLAAANGLEPKVVKQIKRALTAATKE